MSDTMNVTINLSDMVKSVRDFKRFEALVQRGISEGIDDLAEKTKRRLIKNMEYYGLGNTNLPSSIVVTRIGFGGISIVVADEEALFIEYGTGIVGEGEPHPDPQTVGKYDAYDSQGHGYDGWVYIKNGRYRWTAGQESKPFMYHTWLYVERNASRIIRRNIARVVK